MSRRANTNYTAGGTDFDVVTGADSFLKKDLQALQAAVEGHDHTATKGLPVNRIGTAIVGTSQMVALSVDTTILANNAVTTAKILDGAVTAPKLAAGVASGAALGSDVVTLTAVQTITGVKTLSSPTLQNITTVDGIIREDRGVDIASATSITLGDDGNTFLITGNTNISSIGVKQLGTEVRLIFAGALTLVDGGSSLRLAGDFVTAAEAAITLVSMGSYWQEMSRSGGTTNTVQAAFGTYTGNATGGRVIPLPFTPKYLCVRQNDATTGGGLWVKVGAGTPLFMADADTVSAQSQPLFTTNGFIVGASSSQANGNGQVYAYMALG